MLGSNLDDGKRLQVATTMVKAINESSKFWFQCVEEYHSPDDFVASLNALIQSLRNITFRLQSFKSEVNGLSEWYEVQQAKLKLDKKLTWLVNSRNQIVKQQGLKSHSRLKVILSNWNEIVYVDEEIDPLFTQDRIVSAVQQSFEKLYRRGLENVFMIQIVREWRIEDQQDQEVLETVAHCYVALKGLISELLINLRLEPLVIPPFREKTTDIVNCNLPRNARVAVISLEDGSVLRSQYRVVKADHEKIGKILEESNFEELREKLSKKLGVFEDVELLKHTAMHVLKLVTTHFPQLFLYLEDGSRELVMFPIHNKTEFFVFMRNFAETVRDPRYTAVLFIFDQFVKSPDYLQIVGECLSVIALKRTGELLSVTVPYERSANGIVFLAEKKSNSIIGHNWLKPVLEAWNIKH